MTGPWRGSALFVGVAAVIGAAAAARFAAAEDAAPAMADAPSSETTTSGSSDSSSPSASSSADDTDSSTPSSTSTASSDDSAGSDDTEETVVGSTSSTPYGSVQVSVTFKGTTITKVDVLQAPNDQQSDGATPTLASEVVEAQSAKVDTVSGATYTSEAYLESVQYAIDHR
ncbi:hypothetical protein GCM10023221_22150 [Luteimicrobium xylanilyticum]|uniref:LisH domain-containing protein n=1 Tax=Luteimicrobium xylanilyticum TaxID=1133546 RepID=A0A5P9Q634_9MICO|nr:FMN-binding protein [Luteimicrobium xylanilyticum]QFU96853.1 LisH domain-containing protein [Luteimicrobium xylanilyticum]